MRPGRTTFLHQLEVFKHTQREEDFEFYLKQNTEEQLKNYHIYVFKLNSQ